MLFGIKNYYFILFFSCLFSFSLIGQENCNKPSLQQDYDLLCTKVIEREILALPLADSLIEYMETHRETTCSLYLWTKYQKAYILLEVFQKFDASAKLQLEIIREAKARQNYRLLAESYITMALLHEWTDRSNDCLSYLNLAENIIEEYEYWDIYAWYAVRVSSYHRIFGNKKKAIEYARDAVFYGKKYGRSRAYLDGNLLLGILLEPQDGGIKHMQLATEKAVERQDYPGAAMFKRNIVKMYLKLNKVKKAAIHLDTVEQYLHEIPKESAIDYNHVAEKLYEQKSIIFEKKSELDSALFYLRKSVEHEKLYEREVNHKAINEQELLFVRERERERVEHEKSKNLMLKRGLTAVGVLLGVLVLFYGNNIRKKRHIARQNILIRENNIALENAVRHKAVLLAEIHHRVKNNLQLVMSLLVLKGSRLKNPTIKKDLEELSDKVRSIALIHEQLYRYEEFEIIKLSEYFKELFMHFETLQHDGNGFTYTLETNELAFNLETILPVGIICTELIGNSLKYAKESNADLHLNLQISSQDEQYHLIYRDNGAGYPSGGSLEMKRGSLGGTLIRSMVTQLNAKSTTYSDDGAVFEMEFVAKEISKLV